MLGVFAIVWWILAVFFTIRKEYDWTRAAVICSMIFVAAFIVYSK